MTKFSAHDLLQMAQDESNLANAKSDCLEMRKAWRSAVDAIPVDTMPTDTVRRYYDAVPESEDSNDRYESFRRDEFNTWFSSLSHLESCELLWRHRVALVAADGYIRYASELSKLEEDVWKWEMRSHGNFRENAGFKLGLAFGAAAMWCIMIIVNTLT